MEFLDGSVISSLIFGSILAIHQLAHYFYRQKNQKMFKLERHHIEEFLAKGVVVIPSVLTREEVEETKKEFHSYLAKYHVCILICSSEFILV
jgi:hypothetical protein